MQPVTAVLITREASYPTDIRLDFPFDEVLVETRCPNVRRRFELAQGAKNDTIYVQDDDVEIDIPALWARYDGRLTHAITPYHKAAYEGTGVTLIGWGAFFPKKLIDFSRWEAAYGEVDAMEVDRIFTYFAQPHNTVVMPVHEKPRAVRMCMEPDHYKIRDSIVRQLRALDVNIDRAVAIDGWMHWRELEWLAAQARRSQLIVEIGSWKGRSTRALADHTPGIVYAIDHWKGQLHDPDAAPSNEIRARGEAVIRQEFQKNLADVLSTKVIAVDHNSQDGVPVGIPASIDMLFIDGDHSYDGCRSDIELFGPRVRRGGVICGHDYNDQPRHAGVRKVVDEKYGASANFCSSIWWVEA